MFAGKGFTASVAASLAAPDAFVYKGVIDCSGSPNYPAADAGHIYIVSVAGKIGGASGAVVTAGEMLVCNTDGTAAGTEAAVGSKWNIVQANIDLTNIVISGGVIDGTLVGKSNPAELWGSPNVSKGPAIISTGFAGTVTAAASTTVTFSSAADAILAGYSATNPILGTTLISNSLTRYIVSWTNATTVVVDSAVTWAGTAITSVQLPKWFSVTSAGVLSAYEDAAGLITIPSLKLTNTEADSVISGTPVTMVAKDKDGNTVHWKAYIQP